MMHHGQVSGPYWISQVAWDSEMFEFIGADILCHTLLLALCAAYDGLLHAESAAPISTWAPGPGLNGSRGGGFAPAHAAPEQKLDGAHAAYHAVFDRIHPTCNAADAVPLGQRQHSQDSVQQAPDRMAPVGSGGSLSGVNSDTSNPWDSMSPQAHGPTDSTASPPPRASQAKVPPPPGLFIALLHAGP